MSWTVISFAAMYAAAVVLNSANANAATGANGRSNAEHTCALVAEGLGCLETDVLVCSTGLIGIPLPMDALVSGIEPLLKGRKGGEAVSRDRQHMVLRHDVSVVVRRGEIVDRVDGEGHGRHVAFGRAVGDLVGEAVRAVVVRGRRVLERAVHVHAERAVCRVGHQSDCERTALDVRVVDLFACSGAFREFSVRLLCSKLSSELSKGIWRVVACCRTRAGVATSARYRGQST